MNYPTPQSKALLLSSLAVLILTAAAPSRSDHPGYAEDSTDTVVRTGSGGCLHTNRWRPELEIPECGGQPVAVAPTPEPATEQAAFETPRPLETLTLDTRTLFEFDEATLQPAARAKLDELAQRMNSQADVIFVNVTGHADRIGSSEYNEQLSRQRAAAVTDYLQNHTNLRTAKFQVIGAGESKPVVECAESRPAALIDCLEPNRRVEVEVSLTQPVQADAQ